MHISRLLALSSLVAASIATYFDGRIVAHDGEPIGYEEEHNGINMYISKPRRAARVAVLYLTDVFGIQLAQNKLLADSFAKAGFFVIAPDMFDGEPAPEDIETPGFNTTEFLAKHSINVTDPIIEATVRYLKEDLGFEKIATTGYCFGGRYAFRFVADGKGANVAFAAHPSLLQDDEILAAEGAVSVAAAEMDGLMPAERRHEIETLLQSSGVEYQMSLYSGTFHGFGVRADVSDPRQKFAKESAFLQAVMWFKAWV